MRRVLILVACALLLGATIGFLLQKEQTYVLISTKSISFEMTIWIAIIVYLLSISFIISILLLISWILGGSGFKSWLITRKKRKNLLETTKGLIYFSDYDWKNSLTTLEKSAPSSLMPSVNYIYAAKAAAEIDDYDRAYQSLALLKTSDPTSSILVEKIPNPLNSTLSPKIRLFDISSTIVETIFSASFIVRFFSFAKSLIIFNLFKYIFPIYLYQ